MKIKQLYVRQRLCEAYPYGASRWQKMVWKVREAIKTAVRFTAITGLTGSILYGVFMAGAYLNPIVSYAVSERIVHVEVNTIPAVMQRIAKCESGSRQFKDNGKVLRGRTTPEDIGKYQIRETVWNDKARELGFDIYTEQGNEAMAMWIYQNYGTEPWYSSVKCWR